MSERFAEHLDRRFVQNVRAEATAREKDIVHDHTPIGGVFGSRVRWDYVARRERLQGKDAGLFRIFRVES